MKKKFFTITLLTLISLSGLKAQYYYTFDPFSDGDKHLGIEAGLGGWFGSSDVKITNNDYSSNPYYGFNADNFKRGIMNPNVAILYKRVLEDDRISWGNNYRVALNWWNGTVEGSSTTDPTTTFSTTFSYRNVQLSDLYYIMLPIGDILYINAGFGLTIGLNLSPKSTITYSDGRPTVTTTGGTDIMDLIIGTIDFMAGVDYKLTDSFTASLNLIGYPIDFFGLLEEPETKGLRGVGEGLYVSKKFPFQITLGMTYAL